MKLSSTFIVAALLIVAVLIFFLIREVRGTRVEAAAINKKTDEVGGLIDAASNVVNMFTGKKSMQ